MIFSQALLTRRVSSAKQGAFSGLASTWSVDRHNSRIARGAFTQSIAAFDRGERRIPLLLEHNPLEQLGAVMSAKEADEGLQVDATFVLGTPAADRAYQLALADAVGLSVGFMVKPEDIGFDDSGVMVYRVVDLAEVSIVSVPSNREALLHDVRSLSAVAPAELERMLREGVLPRMPRRLAEKITRAVHPLLAGEQPEPEPDGIDWDGLALSLAVAQLKL